jgi:hypothetical protein
MKTGGRRYKIWSSDMERHSSVSLKIKRWKKLILNLIPAPDECKRRIVKREDDDPDAQLTVEEANLDEMDGVVDHRTGVDGEVGRNGYEVVERGLETDGHGPVDAEPEPEDDKASNDPNTQTTAPAAAAARTDNSGANGLSLPTATSSPTATNTIASGGLPPLAITGPSVQLCPTPASTPSMNGNLFALHQAGLPEFHFPEESHLSATQVQDSTTFDPYSCDLSSMTNDWSATPAQSATPSLNPSTGFWFGNGEPEYNPSGLTSRQGAQILY